MSLAPIDLLAECEADGIRLAVAADGGLSIDAPRDALTPELLARLRAQKAELLSALRTVAEKPDEEPEAAQVTATAFTAADTLAWLDWHGTDGYFPCRRIIHNGIEHKVDGCLGRTGWRHIWGGTYCSKCWPATDPASMAEGE